ncbi:MAG: glycosyltransferase family 2 protein [Kiritimatiellae bacterium]|nr:glycosyltransferase family 2 protein [Kiritimatiellia bacterium]
MNYKERGDDGLPTVSIIVPTYNSEKYINTCVDSLLAQTCSNIEIIVVDDGSVDSTPEKLKKYSDDGRVRVVTQKNSGVSAARNAGVAIARGEFVSFVDSDDVMHPDYIEKCLCLARSDDCEFVLIDVAEFDDGEKLTFNSLDGNNFDEVVSPLEYYLDNGFKGGMSSMLVRRRLIQGLQFPEGVSKGEDLCFSYSLLARLKNGRHLHGPAYFYRRTEGSLDRTAMTLKDVVSLANIMRRLYSIYAIDERKLDIIKRHLFTKMIKNIVKRAISNASPDAADAMQHEITSLVRDGVVGYNGFTLRWRWRLWRLCRKHNAMRRV